MSKRVKSIGLVIVWVLLFGIFSFFRPQSFPTAVNIETIVRQTIIVGIASVGMTFIIVCAEIDLSVGSTIALVTMVIATALKMHLNPIVASIAGIAAAMIVGALNGVLTTSLKIGSFIVTLATLQIVRGVAVGFSNGQDIDVPNTYLSTLTSALTPANKWQILPLGGWMVIILAIIASWALRYTVFGRRIVATGSNEATARMCGVNTNFTKTMAFVIGGFFFGLAGIVQFSRLTQGNPTVAVGLELPIIAAVVIGGASLSGGEGSIFGSLIGALIMTTIDAGSNQLNWPNWVQEIATGAIIIAAVGIDRWRMAKLAEKEVV
ncbi:MAG TPA: ABC transporter permease [Fimbriimonadaceae bacterium]